MITVIFSKIFKLLRILLCFVAIVLLKLSKAIETLENSLIAKVVKDRLKVALPPHDVNKLILENRVKRYQSMWEHVAGISKSNRGG